MWIQRYDTLSGADVAAIREHIASLSHRPRISLLLPVGNASAPAALETIGSVAAQLYPDWELCVAVTDPATALELRKRSLGDERLKIAMLPPAHDGLTAEGFALDAATGEFVALLSAGDKLPIHGLYLVAVELNAHSRADLVYSDEDRINARGQRSDPHFKPDWNPSLLQCRDGIGGLSVYRLESVRAVGGFRREFTGVANYDLALRVSARSAPELIRHVPHILYHRRTMPHISAAAGESDENEPARRAFADHLTARGETGTVVPTALPGCHRVVWPLPEPLPQVSLIVPTRDRVHLLRACVDGLLHGTRYPALDLIIVDNESRAPETLDYLRSLDADPRIRVLRIDGPFNFSALNNRAAELARGDIIGFINNDITVIEPGWLDEMVSELSRPEARVGAVGAKLYYADDTIQHAGLILGLFGIAGHGHRHLPRSASGYCEQLGLVREVSAVTAACMLVYRRLFQEVGGFDADNLAVAFNDVDLCLKLREAGYRIIWTPYAELYHLESASRGSDAARKNRARVGRELAYMRKRWGNMLLRDPFYNPNLTLQDESFDLAFPPRPARPWRAH